MTNRQFKAMLTVATMEELKDLQEVYEKGFQSAKTVSSEVHCLDCLTFIKNEIKQKEGK